MNKLEQFDETILKTNPFTFTLSLPVTKIISNVSYSRSPEDGMILNSVFYQEQIESTRVYHCKAKEDVYKLSDKAIRLYMYILYNLKSGKDFIQINEEYYMKKNGIKSINTFKAAKMDLIQNNFILPTIYKTVFWTNPNMFFNGNRLKKYPHNLNIKSTWEQ